MRFALLGIVALLGACGQSPPLLVQTEIKADCRTTGGDGTICVVGHDDEATCILFHEGDRGEMTELRRDVPRPEQGCVWDYSPAQPERRGE